MELIVRIFFVGLISFTPTGDEDWLALLLNAEDRYGVAVHSPTLIYCPDAISKERCLVPKKIPLAGVRLDLDFPSKTVENLNPFESPDPACNPDAQPAPDDRECARDYRWIPGVQRTMGRETKRRWCCRDWFFLKPCSSVSYIVLEHGRLENCRFVEGGPPSLPTAAIYGLSGLRTPKPGLPHPLDERSRVASEIAMVKITIDDWNPSSDYLVLDFQGLPRRPPKTDDQRLYGTLCENGKACIDLLVDNRPHALDGLSHRPLSAEHFDLYRSVWGRTGRAGAGMVPTINEAMQVPLSLHPCGLDESPLLASEFLLGAGNERPICPQSTSN